MGRKSLKLQVRIKQENKVKIKLRVENGGHLSKLDERRVQEHLENLGRVEMMSPSLLTSSWRRGRINNFDEFWSLNELKEEA